MLKKEKERRMERKAEHMGGKYFRAYINTFAHCFSLDATAADENMIAPIRKKKKEKKHGSRLKEVGSFTKVT